MAKKDADRALKAVKAYAAAAGVTQEVFRNTPLHYSMADLVAGLMELSHREGRMDFEAVLRDAREVFEDELKTRKAVRVMDPNTLLCAVHGTPVSAKESEPCKDCVEEFSTSKRSR